MFWKNKKPRKFWIYVSGGYPFSISVSFENYGRDVMRIYHYEIHEVIGLIEATIATKKKHYVENYFINNSITINEMRAILPLLKQAVYTARAKGANI